MESKRRSKVHQTWCIDFNRSLYIALVSRPSSVLRNHAGNEPTHGEGSNVDNDILQDSHYWDDIVPIPPCVRTSAAMFFISPSIAQSLHNIIYPLGESQANQASSLSRITLQPSFCPDENICPSQRNASWGRLWVYRYWLQSRQVVSLKFGLSLVWPVGTNFTLHLKFTPSV